MSSPPDARVPDLAELVTTRRVLVCCGSGGVGKTTTAAVLAIEGARRGRRAVVVTIDPARRLADALGAGPLDNAPRRIEGSWPGELWALMLDTKSTFDTLVAMQAADDGQARRILDNRFYRNISGALSGTDEFMAGEKLYELHEDGRFDLIVVDTPPARRALDFLDASSRLTRFLDHRVYRLLISPTGGSLRAVNLAARALARTVGRVVGSEVLDDAVAFFAAFDGMEEGFKRRARRVQALLAEPGTAFVLVASARADTVAEATYLAERLGRAGVSMEALVVNRLHPRFGPGNADTARQAAQASVGTALGPFWTNLADLRAAAEAEEAVLGGLTSSVAPAPTARVPFLDDDVHDLPGLERIRSALFDGAQVTRRRPGR